MGVVAEQERQREEIQFLGERRAADGSETTKSSEPSFTNCMVCASLPRIPPLKMSIWIRPLLSSLTFLAK